MLLFITVVLCWASAWGQVPPGGQHPINITQTVKDACVMATNVINDRSNCVFWQTLLDEANATVQVVSGEIYRVFIELGTSNCTNSPDHHNATQEQCPVAKDAKRSVCYVEVLYKHWEKDPYTMMNFDCPETLPIVSRKKKTGRNKF